MRPVPVIDQLEVASYRVPTDEAESDGTLAWDQTGVVVVRVTAGGVTGLGWSYAAPAVAVLVSDTLRHVVLGRDAFGIEGAYDAMKRALRNAGVPGAGSMAISAVDVALWDLKAKLMSVSLADLFGRVRDAVPAYGSGGFTSYTDARLVEQLSSYVARGLKRVKMKVGRDPRADVRRVRLAREAIGDDVELFVDANGAYSVKQALLLAGRFVDDARVTWLEEPRPSSDLEGLAYLRAHSTGGIEIAAGEYGDAPDYFRRMLSAGAVDCLQADVTRCGGYTGFLRAAALAEAFQIPLSAHCAPELHAHVGCAVAGLRHVEYFHDHERIAGLFFDGTPVLENGCLRPDSSRFGHGISLKTEARVYRV